MKTHLQFYKFVLGLLLLLFTKTNYAQAPAIQWQNSYGGSNNEYASSIKQTTDGGYIIAGASESNDGDVTGNHGIIDYWIVKTDIYGNVLWQKSYGGTLPDVANDILQTTEGGYIIAGRTYDSLSGDVGPGHGAVDAWIVKTDSLGTIQWQKCYGGTESDCANAIQQTTDGGYIVAGLSNSHDGDVAGNHSFASASDAWIIKLDTGGIIQWQKCLGGLGDEGAFDVTNTNDKGYVVAGYSYSIDGDVTANHGYEDYWIVKLDSTGLLQWQKSFGGTSGERAQSITQTSDGGYIVAGFSNSNDIDVTCNHSIGEYDYWIIKLNTTGNVQWKNCYGGLGTDYAYTVKQTIDGGYILAGTWGSNAGNATGYHGGRDYWILKLDTAGNIQWEKCYGGTSVDNVKSGDVAHGILQTTDGGYIVSGSSSSTDGDVTGNHGNLDFWIVKLAGILGVNELGIKDDEFIVYPNPSSEKVFIMLPHIFQKTYITITDLQGRIIKNELITSKMREMDVSELPSGMYLLKVENEQGVIIKKIIVQH